MISRPPICLVGVVNSNRPLFRFLHVILLDLVSPTSGRTDVSNHLGQRLRDASLG
jgi:hypothetical protein